MNHKAHKAQMAETVKKAQKAQKAKKTCENEGLWNYKFPSERIRTYCEGVGTSLCTKSKHSRRGFSLANNET